MNWGPFLENPGKSRTLRLQSCLIDISSLNMKTGSLHTRSFRRIHFSVLPLKYRLNRKYSLNRVLKLQKRAARIILNADSQASSVKLFNKLKWIPFYEQAKIAKCCIIYKRLQGHVPAYLKSLLESLAANQICKF